MSWADNCQKLMKFAHELSKSSSPQYQCTYQFDDLVHPVLAAIAEDAVAAHSSAIDGTWKLI